MLFTLGYQGMCLDEFLDLIEAAGIETVVDVRELPLSRKRGFSKTPLSAALKGRCVTYVHLRSLGCPKHIRRSFACDEDWPLYVWRYQQYLAGRQDDLLSLLSRIERQSCCLVCYELEARRCHRSLVARAIQELTGQPVGVQHLRPQALVEAAL